MIEIFKNPNRTVSFPYQKYIDNNQIPKLKIQVEANFIRFDKLEKGNVLRIDSFSRLGSDFSLEYDVINEIITDKYIEYSFEGFNLHLFFTNSKFGGYTLNIHYSRFTNDEEIEKNECVFDFPLHQLFIGATSKEIIYDILKEILEELKINI